MRKISLLITALACALPHVVLAGQGAEIAGAAEAVDTVVAAGAQPTHGTMVTSDGLNIHYLTQGRGVPVILIHGFSGSADGNWYQNGVAPALAQDHYVVSIDCRGHGESDKPSDPARYGDRIWMDVIELMHHLKIDKAHIHGYSMGGSITTQLLTRFPHRFITASFGGSGIREIDEKYIAATPKDVEGSDPQQFEALKTITAYGTRSEESRLALEAIRGSSAYSTSVPFDMTTIKFPVLAINGEFDSPIARTHRMERELANFKSVVLPGKSHLTAIMAGYMPQQYLDELRDFINANDPE